MIENLWEDGRDDSAGLAVLAYRSRLLGKDRRVSNWGGGNTSSKVRLQNFKGDWEHVLYVKGSGSDLATISERGFAGLRMDDIAPLLNRDEMSDEDMVEYLAHCVTEPNLPRSSIETLLHAFLPFPEVDHTHPDAILGICCSVNGKVMAEEAFGGEAVWIPYIRPGFSLAKMVAEAVRSQPDARLVLLEKHGLITWGETPAECYHNTIETIQKAEAYLEERVKGDVPFGGSMVQTLPGTVRDGLLTEILPVIRGSVSAQQPMILHYDDSPAVMEFVNGRASRELSQVGAACPDHLVHTKRVPLFVEWTPGADREELIKRIREGMEAYANEYRAYVKRHQKPGEAAGDPYPRIILIPGVGMVSTGKSKYMAEVSASLYQRAIAVTRVCSAVDQFTSLSEEESYAIEYWPLELYKLSLAPPEQAFSRRVALITGGAGGIGKATAKRLLGEGAHVVLADLNAAGAKEAAQECNTEYGEGRCLGIALDVTEEDSVAGAYRDAILQYGGLDIVVSNAGIASSQSVENTSLQEWQKNIDVLATGYFLVSRAAFQLFQRQGTGGNIVFVASKNAMVAGKNASAYSAAKAAELHLARCLAEEGGGGGIRVNTVCPDAVLQGSAIWSSSWREERASAYGITADELDEHYRQRTTLKVNIFPEDIAEAIAYFASSRSAKTTGCILTVDGGVAAAYTR